MDLSKIKVTQHAIDQYTHRYLNIKKHNQNPREGYEKLIRAYMEKTVEITMPKFIEVEKALKYERISGDHIFLLNRVEKLLFVIVNESLVTIYYPYNDSQRFQRRAVPSSSQVRRKRKKKRK